jgi:hypothetical protein
MCKVDGAFVLMPIDEITSLRPDLSKFVEEEAAKDAAVNAREEDADCKPAKVAAAGHASAVGASASSRAVLKTVTVGVTLLPRQCCHLARLQPLHWTTHNACSASP